MNTTNRRQFTILVVDDEQSELLCIKRFFSKHNYQLILTDTGEEGLSILAKDDSINLLLLDLRMPDMDGLTILKKAKEIAPNLKVIIQTGHGGINDAVKAIRMGASDFLEKKGSPKLLQNRVGLIYDNWLLNQKKWKGEERREYTFDYDKFVGESPPIRKLKDLIVRVAATDTTVLIQGESGTGKELVAQALHYHSPRREAPFVIVDCASICENVIESELFGHEKGAFTGAEKATKGLVRAANQGTIFFDEIGELSLGFQAKLLRVIQEQTIRPVGSTKNYTVDIRIIAATHRNMLEEMSDKQFRQDLYYRLSTVTLTAPPLNERGDDIPLLTTHILNQNQNEDTTTYVTDKAQFLLNNYAWPGNVRELENVLRGALVFADEGKIKPEDLPPSIGDLDLIEDTPELKIGTLASYELTAIKNALAETGNNRRKAARILDIAEATLYRKIKQYAL
ncbi:MAG: sigma-54 dependent transcriptional regulator [Desulfotalea sp.]